MSNITKGVKMTKEFKSEVGFFLTEDKKTKIIICFNAGVLSIGIEEDLTRQSIVIPDVKTMKSLSEYILEMADKAEEYFKQHGK